MPASPALSRLLIRRAELSPGERRDVLVEGGVIRAIAPALAGTGAIEVDAAGACLLPGLHDHHVHAAATAVALQSVSCGPPDVRDPADLARVLVAAPGTGWLRGFGYDEGVAGLLTRHQLDAILPDRPVRLQHRSGRMWFLNSAGLDILLGSGQPLPPGLERGEGGWTGRLFDADLWLRTALGGSLPDLAPVGLLLARRGVTGITDMSAANGTAEAEHVRAQQAAGSLPQTVVLAGTRALEGLEERSALRRGPFKLHLHEADLPDWDDTVQQIRAARAHGRGTAVHCVTETELAFAVGLFAELGSSPADRIEHGSVVTDGLLERLVDLNLPVVVQPGFVLSRGDRYLATIPPADHPALYRLEGLRQAGLVLAGGSDAPYGPLNPWLAMHCAVGRRTAAGALFGPDEALTPEAALALYLADPLDLRRTRRVTVGERADLCLLDRSWQDARSSLDDDLVRATFVGGIPAYHRAD